MKRLVFLACMIPFISFGQRFEVSELGGYGGLAGPISNAYQYGTVKCGFSNLLSVDYNLNNIFSLGAAYGLNSWNFTGNCFGIAANAHYYELYAGLDVSAMMFHNKTGSEQSMPAVTYKPALSTGVHVGAENRIYKCLYTKEQIGLNYSSLTFNYNTTFMNGAYMPAEYHEKCTIIYILLGVACKFGGD